MKRRPGPPRIDPAICRDYDGPAFSWGRTRLLNLNTTLQRGKL